MLVLTLAIVLSNVLVGVLIMPIFGSFNPKTILFDCMRDARGAAVALAVIPLIVAIARPWADGRGLAGRLGAMGVVVGTAILLPFLRVPVATYAYAGGLGIAAAWGVVVGLFPRNAVTGTLAGGALAAAVALVWRIATGIPWLTPAALIHTLVPGLVTCGALALVVKLLRGRDQRLQEPSTGK